MSFTLIHSDIWQNVFRHSLNPQLYLSRFLLPLSYYSTMCPVPRLSIWAERLKQMARCLMASSVCASKKSCGRRNERCLLFFSFLRLFIPALEGDSSLAFGWLETFEEFCWLKCVGTWRASPPWEAKLALQPPTTHWKGKRVGVTACGVGHGWSQQVSRAVTDSRNEQKHSLH